MRTSVGCSAAFLPERHSDGGELSQCPSKERMGAGRRRWPRWPASGFGRLRDCAGHQTTAAQLAVLLAQRRKLWGRNFLGRTGLLRNEKRWWGLCLYSRLACTSCLPGRCHLFFSERGCGLWGAESLKRHRVSPSPEQDLLPHAGLTTLPPALVAGTNLPGSACCSLPDCHPGRPMGATRASCASAHADLVPARAPAAEASWAFCFGTGLIRQGGVTSTAPTTSALSSSTACGRDWLHPNAWSPFRHPQTPPRRAAKAPAQGLQMRWKRTRSVVWRKRMK